MRLHQEYDSITALLTKREVKVAGYWSRSSARFYGQRRSRGSPIKFSNAVIPTQHFVQSRNPGGYFWHPTSWAYFQSRFLPDQIKETPDPEKPIGDPCRRG